MMDLSPQCFILTFIEIGPLVPGKIFDGFYHIIFYAHGGNVTSIMLINFLSLYLKAYILSVNEKLPVSKFRYFGKYIIQLSSTFSFVFLVNDKLVWKKYQFNEPWN